MTNTTDLIKAYHSLSDATIKQTVPDAKLQAKLVEISAMQFGLATTTASLYEAMAIKMFNPMSYNLSAK